MKQILNRYQFDDMVVCYEINDEKQVGLFLYPASLQGAPRGGQKQQRI